MKVKLGCRHVVETAVKFRSTRLCPSCRMHNAMLADQGYVILTDGKNPAILNKSTGIVEMELPSGLVCKISARDWARIRKYPWCIVSSGYVGRLCSGRTVYLHRVIMLGSLKAKQPADRRISIDHCNYNKLDNTRTNLRLCTCGQNNAHRRFAGAEGGSIGVYKHDNHWEAYVGHGAGSYVGCFSTKEEAARARDKRAIELYGDFATLNYPEAI